MKDPLSFSSLAAVENEDDITDKEHNRLINNLKNLHGSSKILPFTRTEHSSQISVLHLGKPRKRNETESYKPTVYIQDILNELKESKKDINRIKKFQKKAKTVPVPLEKIHAEKIKRQIGFDNAKKTLDRWNNVIEDNRVATQLKFPLKSEQIIMNDHKVEEDFMSTFRNSTPLEKKMAALLKSSKVAREEKELEENDFHLTLGELIQRRKTFARIRAQTSYKVAKAWRQNKIKSKSYHRLLRHERIKQQLKDFESLQNTNPEAALKQLELLEKSRAEERATLRHRNTGKWAKNQIIKAKYNKESRIALSEQMRKNRELTTKRKAINNLPDEENDCDKSREESSGDEQISDAVQNELQNEYELFVNDYQKYHKLHPKNNGVSNKCLKNDKLNDNKGDERNAVSITRNREGDVATDGNASSKLQSINSTGYAANEENHKCVENESDIANNKANSNLNKSKNILSADENGLSDYKFCDEKQEDNKVDQRTNKSQEHSGVKDGISDTNNTSITGSYKNQKTKNSSSKSCAKIKKYISASGSWKVASDDDTNYVEEEVSNNKNNTDKSIDAMFDHLEHKLSTEVKRKLNTIQKDLNGTTKRRKKKHLQEKLEEKSKNRKTKSCKVLHENTSSLNKNMVSTDANKLSKTINFSTDKKTNNSSNHCVDINPDNFLKLTPKNLFQLNVPTAINEVEDCLDDTNEDTLRHAIISEAFADDNVLADFDKEKEEAINDSLPKEIDVSLPGWGTWTGVGVHNPKTTKKKRERINKRMLFKIPTAPPKKDCNKGRVIIKDEKDTKFREHMVNTLPYPFKNVADFVSTIKAPVGRNWIPETAHKDLIAPRVVTKLGQVIEPMDESYLPLVNTSKLKLQKSSQ